LFYECFFGVDKTICVCVPVGSVNSYKTAEGWKEFTNIFECTTCIPVGIDENLFDNISIFPNPTSGDLRIESGELKIESVEIYDIYGRILSSNHLITSSSHHLINISHLSAGVYFMKINTEKGQVFRKVLKE